MLVLYLSQGLYVYYTILTVHSTEMVDVVLNWVDLVITKLVKIVLKKARQNGALKSAQKWSAKNDQNGARAATKWCAQTHQNVRPPKWCAQTHQNDANKSGLKVTDQRVRIKAHQWARAAKWCAQAHKMMLIKARQIITDLI
jgi:hypothetical protein